MWFGKGEGKVAPQEDTKLDLPASGLVTLTILSWLQKVVVYEM